MKRLLFILAVIVNFQLSIINSLSAQELRAKVVINTAQLSNTKTEVFDALKEKAESFLNDHQWTNMQYREQEKIECNFNITVNSWDEGESLIKSTLLMTCSRPVFNSSYNTTLYSVRDGDFQFNFQTTDQLEWNPEYIDNNLTALLAYYAYMIIGYDMDSMAPKGGTSCFQTAENIVTNAQNLGFPGWSSFSDSKNRFGLLNDYLDGSMEDYRNLIYKYHREGLDQMADNAEKGRSAITEAIDLLEASKDARTMSHLPQLFTEYKRDELVNIYSGHGTSQEKEGVYDILFGINTSLSDYWEKIKK
ncbi:MAG: DUF4835 family protein [Bacteroidaceae bacterium]|nr:DUF4835 family protein [Bacteroidaceae bacterium]